MNQQAYQEITKMLNAFPQSAADIRGLLLTYDEALTGLDDGAICATAGKFVRGEVAGQNKTFAPSIAEFRDEVRRTPVPGRAALPAPQRDAGRQMSATEQARMRLKVPLFNFAFAMGRMDELAAANKGGMSEMIALALGWGIEVPPELYELSDHQAEQQWRTARNRAWAEIERDPPPFMRGRALEILRGAA